MGKVNEWKGHKRMDVSYNLVLCGVKSQFGLEICFSELTEMPCC